MLIRIGTTGCPLYCNDVINIPLCSASFFNLICQTRMVNVRAVYRRAVVSIIYMHSYQCLIFLYPSLEVLVKEKRIHERKKKKIP